MKGLTTAVAVATAITLGLLPWRAHGESRTRETTSGGSSAVAYEALRQDTAGLRSAAGGYEARSQEETKNLDGSHGTRRLQRTPRNAGGQDDALDVNGSPNDRALNALEQRQQWAEIEYEASRRTRHISLDDRSSAASFHKTLPHDKLGQVDVNAFDALIACVSEGTYEACESVPAGDDDGYLVQPIGGIAVDMAGPASSAVTVPSAPAINSEDLAAQLAEVYWMSLTRDVPFSKYGENEDTIAAADNLATMPGFAKMNGVAVDSEGRADPQSQLFRSTAVGVETGPFISQLLVKDVSTDSLTITPKETTFASGLDYMTNYDDWLFVQNGGSHDVAEEEDPEERYIRNARDLARLVATDTIFTEALRGALILLTEGAISRDGFNGPYANSGRQQGFVSFGVSHVMKILGSAEMAQRSSWYQKWNVHLFARPEAVAGTLHNVLYGELDVEFHSSLLSNKGLLERVGTRNMEINEMNGQEDGLCRTYLLSQALRGGSPAHPSYPAGHAVQNGAFATVLKALVGLERGALCFEDPVYPDDNGFELLSYTGDDCLTYEGEINKLAVNIAFGRQMCGVHYRFDSEEGLRLGEIIAVRMLQQEVVAFPEQEGYEFGLMAGETIRLEPDGTFYIDDRQCNGAAFEGVASC